MFDEKIYAHVSGGIVAVSSPREDGGHILMYAKRPMYLYIGRVESEEDITFDQDGKISLDFVNNVSRTNLIEEPTNPKMRAAYRSIYYYILKNAKQAGVKI